MEEEQKTNSRSHGEQEEAQKTSSFSTTLLAGSGLMYYGVLPLPLPVPSLFHWDFSQSNALDGGPDDRQATHLGGEHVDLIGALAHIAEKTFNGIGGLDVAMHDRWKRVKRQQMLFILRQASHRFRVALSLFGFERIEIGERIFLLLLFPDACEVSLNVFALSSRDSTHHIAQLMDQTALARRAGKQLISRSK